MSLNSISQLVSSIDMAKESQFSLSSERLEFLIQQGLYQHSSAHAATTTTTTTTTNSSPSLSIQGSFSSASPASSRDYFHSPEQVSDEEVFDFAFDQPLFPTSQGGAGIDSSLQSKPAQNWFPLFNDNGNAVETNSMNQSKGAPRVLTQDQLTTVAPASVGQLDLGMTIKNFLDASPASTPSPTASTISSQQSIYSNDNGQDEDLDVLAKNFLRKFAGARKAEDVSFLVNAFRGAGIEISNEILNSQTGGHDEGKTYAPYAPFGQVNVENPIFSNQLPSFGLSNYDSHSSSSNSCYSSSIGGSPIPDWNPNDYSLMNQSSDSILSNPLSSSSSATSAQDSAKVRSSAHSATSKGGVKKPHAGGKRRSGEGNPKCPECGKEFSRMFNMKTHLETHLAPEERPKPFVCDVESHKCSRGFSRRSDLKRHIRTVHPNIKETNDARDLDTMIKDELANSSI